MNPLKWLLTKSEPSIRESTVSDITASEPVAAEAQEAQEAAPVVAVKTGVKDFEAAFTFVEQGVAQLGVAAKDELKALAQKYL